jgi:hypothetical protein
MRGNRSTTGCRGSEVLAKTPPIYLISKTRGKMCRRGAKIVPTEPVIAPPHERRTRHLCDPGRERGGCFGASALLFHRLNVEIDVLYMVRRPGSVEHATTSAQVHVLSCIIEVRRCSALSRWHAVFVRCGAACSGDASSVAGGRSSRHRARPPGLPRVSNGPGVPGLAR